MSVKAYRIDDRGNLKTTSLGFVRVSEHLIELIEKHVRENGLKNKSAFIRYCIRSQLNLSVDDVIKCERPFMPLAPDSLLKKKGLK